MRSLILALAVWLGCGGAPPPPPAARPAEPPAAVSDRAAAPPTVMDRVVRELCSRPVVLLGEESSHGNGNTVAFKAALVRRLIDECGFGAFYIEAGIYDFIAIERRAAQGQLERAAVAAAIGGMWANRDMAPLVDLLTERARAGKLVLGGIDDQIGRGSWAGRGMADELLPGLPEPRQAACRASIQQYMTWSYSDADPYTPDHARFIAGCWRELDAAPRRGDPRQAEASHQLLDSLDRLFTRAANARSTGSTPDLVSYNHRDHSMFRNLAWWMARAPGGTRSIIWTATIHAAKSLRSLDAPQRELRSFGSYVHDRFGDDAFVLGFSARAGSHSIGSSRRSSPIEPAPPDSLEGRVFAQPGGDLRYLTRAELGAMGTLTGRVISHQGTRAAWDTVVDGLVVLAEERPPRLDEPAPGRP